MVRSLRSFSYSASGALVCLLSLIGCKPTEQASNPPQDRQESEVVADRLRSADANSRLVLSQLMYTPWDVGLPSGVKANGTMRFKTSSGQVYLDVVNTDGTAEYDILGKQVIGAPDSYWFCSKNGRWWGVKFALGAVPGINAISYSQPSAGFKDNSVVIQPTLTAPGGIFTVPATTDMNPGVPQTIAQGVEPCGGSVAVAPPTGQVPVGQAPVGQVPVGQVPVGQVPVGQVPVGQVPVGQVPVGQVPVDPTLGKVPIYDPKGGVIPGKDIPVLPGKDVPVVLPGKGVPPPVLPPPASPIQQQQQGQFYQGADDLVFGFRELYFPQPLTAITNAQFFCGQSWTDSSSSYAQIFAGIHSVQPLGIDGSQHKYRIVFRGPRSQFAPHRQCFLLQLRDSQGLMFEANFKKGGFLSSLVGSGFYLDSIAGSSALAPRIIDDHWSFDRK